MKKLVICRHAKSDWGDPFLSDRNRPLASRGLNDAPEMALRLQLRGVKPDLLVTSDAVRALETARITATHLAIPSEKIVVDKSLYHANPEALLNTIRGTTPDVDTLLIFGHNPGLNGLIDSFGDPIENLPTCGQYGITFHVEDWAHISDANAAFWFFDFPKSKFPNI